MICLQGDSLGNFFPSEILLNVLSAVSDLPGNQQETLASCCLVSRQWYSVAVEFLYRSPQVAPRNFLKFARAICPDRFSSRSPRSGLGHYVHRFSMANLVHESSNSLTARLLGRMKGNLEYFVAPQASFSGNSLVPISKTKTLQTLNLSYVKQVVELRRLKKSIRNLDHLKSLFLPAIATCPYFVVELDQIPWPPNLRRIRVYDITVCLEDSRRHGSTTPGGRMAWPDTVTSVVYQPRVPRLWLLRNLTFDHYLARSIQRFKLIDGSGTMEVASNFCVGGAVPANLTFFSISGHLVSTLMFDLRTFPSDAFTNLETLEFGDASGNPIDFPLGHFLELLNHPLRKLRRLGVHESCTDEKWDDLESELSLALESNAIEAGYDKTGIQSGEIPVGVYYFD